MPKAKGWKCGLSGSELDQQAHGPEFEPQCLQERLRKREREIKRKTKTETERLVKPIFGC